MKMRWTTSQGVSYPLNRLEDQHLANIWWHLNHYCYNSVAVPLIAQEIRRRGMPNEFLKGAPYPYFDMVEKCWKKWSIDEMRDVEL